MGLCVDVCVKNCSVTAYDETFYEEMTDDGVIKHALVEFLCYLPYKDDEIVPINDSKRVTFFSVNADLTPEDRHYCYQLDKDGRYVYYKYILYTIDHPSIARKGIYRIKNKLFYHNDTIYYGLKDVKIPEFNSDNTEKVYNWYDLQEYVSLTIGEFFGKELLSFCKLEECLYQKQREWIFQGLDKCNPTPKRCQQPFNSCDFDRDIKLERDFLFASVYVLNYLREVCKFGEAQRIIECLATCTSICNTSDRCGCVGIKPNNKGCGCGKVV